MRSVATWKDSRLEGGGEALANRSAVELAIGATFGPILGYSRGAVTWIQEWRAQPAGA